MAEQGSSAAFDSDKMMACRKKDAMNGMPACVARMVAGHEKLQCSASGSSFQITDVLDGGGFATLVRGRVHMKSAGAEQVAAAKIAVDMETDSEGKLTAAQCSGYHSQMRHEHQIYERLQAAQGSSHGIPTVHFAGVVKKAGDADHPNKMHFLSFMVMELLGPSVGYLSLDGAYVDNAPLLVSHGLGMLQVLKFMHKHGIVHRDVKPDNFCLPRGADALHPTPQEKVFIVDMGMAHQYSTADYKWDSRDFLYMGTVDYSSVRALYGHHPCAWDDLEALAICLLEMATGQVPFDLVQSDDPLTAERLQEMAAQKDKQWQAILAKPETPTFVKQWMRHLRGVPPKQHPTEVDYTILQDILKSALSPSTAASSTWSCAVSLLQPKAPAAAAVDSKKRPLPAASAASNMVSSMSEAATIVQPKRAKYLQQEDDDTASMATGLVFSQALLLSQAEE